MASELEESVYHNIPGGGGVGGGARGKVLHAFLYFQIRTSEKSYHIPIWLMKGNIPLCPWHSFCLLKLV